MIASMSSVTVSSSRLLALFAIESLAVQNTISTECHVVIRPRLPLGGPCSGVKSLARVMFIIETSSSTGA